MTVPHRGEHQREQPGVLDDADRAEFERLLAADPLVNAVVLARLRSVGSMRPPLLGGELIGLRARGALTAACFSGGNLVPVGGQPDQWVALARHVAHRRRVCTSVVGRVEAIRAMWPILAREWGPARSIRWVQPLLVCDGSIPTGVDVDPDVRPARTGELERYTAAAAAMFAEELGVSARVAPGSAAFRLRVRELIATGRALARYDGRGRVVFKAEIAAVSAHTAQIQGVWVRPDLRGRGIGTRALAAVLRSASTLAPTVSLYVNDYNVPARRMYHRLGMQEAATLSTVLL